MIQGGLIISNPLQTQLDALAQPFPGQVGFFARHLQTQATVARAADTPQPTMSAGKVLVLLAYADAVTRQRLDAARRVILQPEDILPGTGALRYCAPGLALALSDLAALMITHSDNVATNLLLRELGGPEAVNAYLDSIGVRDARCLSPIFQGNFSVSTPRALAEVYATLQQPEGVGEAAQLARALLIHHQDLEGMSRHLPWSPHAADFGVELPLTVYSKSGQFPGTQVEAGLFVTPRGAYVAAAMCTGVEDPRTHSPAPGSQFLADFGRLLYKAWDA
jgi:beta-lactamase class A